MSDFYHCHYDKTMQDSEHFDSAFMAEDRALELCKDHEVVVCYCTETNGVHEVVETIRMYPKRN